MPKELPANTFTLGRTNGAAGHPRLQLNDDSDIPRIQGQPPKNGRAAGSYIDVFSPGKEGHKPPHFEKYCAWVTMDDNGAYQIVPDSAVMGWAAEKADGNVDRWHYSAEHEGWFGQLQLPEASTESKLLAIGLWQNSTSFATVEGFFKEHHPTPGSHKPSSTTGHHTVVVIIDDGGN